MYPNENEEKKVQPNTADDNVNNASYSEPPQNEAFYSKPVHNMPIYGHHPYSAPPRNEPVYNAQPNTEPVYNEHTHLEHAYREPVQYNQPIQNEPVYYNEQVYGEQPYGEQRNADKPYGEPFTLENAYGEHYDDPQNMYSPGICVNRPYPRARENGNGSNGNGRNGNGRNGNGRNGNGSNGNGRNGHHENGKGLVGFLRAMALVIACTFFSGSAAYIVIDHRLNNNDFGPRPHVTLGNGMIDRRPDDSAPVHVVSREEGMNAQDIYDMARNQVVVINTDAPGMFGLPDIMGESAPISGSGFIISNDGYILTNYHVIEIAHRNDLPIRVILNDGTSYEAKVIGFEESNDVAVIKIEATGLNPVYIGNSDNTRVGETVYAIGNPFGDLVYTMTDGIVSALDRVVSVEGKSIRTFQFSAAVNSGNSGGPIYNAEGEVIGIVTAKVVRGNVEGIGFAIPINDAIEIATELIEHGYISGRPLIGITGQNVSPANAEYFNWVVGIYIRSVASGSAADAAGMEVGDIITALDGNEVTSMETLRFALRDHRAGETTSITIWRDGTTLNLMITFDEDMYAGQQRPRVEPDSPDPFENRP